MNFSLFSARSLTNVGNQRWSSNFSSSWVLSPPRTMTSCTAQDIVKFLISVDRSGRTMVHSLSCSKRGCNCPKRLAAESVDSTLGHLRAIFNKLGCANGCNPASHPLVKDYLKFVREEQAGLAITPSRAVPIFFGKFQRLIAHHPC